LAEWELLLTQARLGRLHARLAHHLRMHGWLDGVPSGPRQHLEGALRAAERQKNQVLWEIDQLRVALSDVDSPIVLLKGAAYIAADLPPLHGRLFTDVDFMVRREALSATENSLIGAGWVPQKLDPYDDRYYRRWMHELPPFKHVWRHTWLDVHHTITPPTSRFAVSGSRLMARIQPLQAAGQLATLAPEDMVLHSAVHLLQEGEFATGLRDLLDMKDLLRHFGVDDQFWPQLIGRAEELGLQRPLFHVLNQVTRLFGTEVPPHVKAAAQALGHGPTARVLMPRLLTLALRPAHVSCDTPMSAAARLLLYARSHALRMPWYRIVPHLLRKAWTRAVQRISTSDLGPP
jgi:hypothetical protein